MDVSSIIYQARVLPLVLPSVFVETVWLRFANASSQLIDVDTVSSFFPVPTFSLYEAGKGQGHHYYSVAFACEEGSKSLLAVDSVLSSSDENDCSLSAVSFLPFIHSIQSESRPWIVSRLRHFIIGTSRKLHFSFFHLVTTRSERKESTAKENSSSFPLPVVVFS